MTAPSPTLAALLALLDEREPLDVGPCPVCGGRRHLETFYTADEIYDHDPEYAGPWTFQCNGMNEHDEDGAYYTRPCPECSEPGPEVECGACKGRGKAHVTKALRPLGHPDQRSGCVWADCPKCDGTGKRPGPPQPTGRDRRTPGQALRDALGAWKLLADGWGPHRRRDALQYAEVYRKHHRWAALRVRKDGDWIVEELVFDKDARDALTVYADALMSPGEAMTRRSPEENLLGQAIALALAGECRECEGSGAEHLLRGAWLPGDGDLGQKSRRCPKCNGEGAAVGELAAEIRALHLRSIVDMPAKEPAPA